MYVLVNLNLNEGQSAPHEKFSPIHIREKCRCMTQSHYKHYTQKYWKRLLCVHKYCERKFQPYFYNKMDVLNRNILLHFNYTIFNCDTPTEHVITENVIRAIKGGQKRRPIYVRSSIEILSTRCRE